MSWVNKYLSKDGIAQIEAKISEVEEKTSGEVVPVIVKRSSNVGHVAPMMTLFLMVCLFFIRPHALDMLWVAPWVYMWPFILVGIFFICLMLAKYKWLQRVFTPNHDELLAVHQRAELEFYRNKVFRTEGGTGILIFVSVMERKAVILADKGISSKIPNEHWDDVLNKFNIQLKKGNWSEAFVQAIAECGRDLEQHFPIHSSAVNELKNHLVIRD